MEGEGYNKKRIITFILVIFSLATLIPLVAFFTKYKIDSTSLQIKQKPKLIKESSITEVISENHPKLFYADLEYDPKTSSVTQLETGTANGDLPVFPLEPPPTSSARFVYKIEVASEKNELFQQGWDSVHKDLILTPKGTLNFRVTTLYRPNAVVRVYLPGNIRIWTGVIK